MTFFIALFFGVIAVMYGAALLKWAFAQGIAVGIGILVSMLGVVGLAWVLAPEEEKAQLRAAQAKARATVVPFRRPE